MRDTETLIKGFLDDSIAIKDLSVEELDAVMDELFVLAEGLLNTEHHEVGMAMLKVLDETIDRYSVEPSDGFEEAIVAAENRGSTYWEFENPSVH